MNQMNGLIRNSPVATFHLCFDNDTAGKQFTENFKAIAKMVKPYSDAALEYKATPGHVEIDFEKEQAFDKLPEPIRKKYYEAYSKSEELATAYLCPEDQEDLRKEIKVLYNELGQ